MTASQTTFGYRTLRAAIAIAAGGLVLPAHALELGAANLRSGLGERLLVEIPITSDLPLPAGCVDARIGSVGGTLRTAGQRQRPDGIVLSTPRIVSEPMLALTVTVACPGLPRLKRDYTLFLDPAVREGARKPSVLAATRPTAAATRRRAPRAAPEPATTVRRYRVQTGDTVSAIAASLTPRGQDYWQTVDRIVAANPGAFVDGDPDRLLAGSLLTLPGSVAVGNRATPLPPVDAPAISRPVPIAAPVANAAPAASQAPTVTPAPTAVAAEPEAEIAARSTADRLLNVLNAPAQTPAVPDSPFADAATVDTPVASNETVAATEAVAATPPRISWTIRLIGLGAGMAIALVAFAVWPRGKRSASRREAARRSIEPPRAPMPASLRAELPAEPDTVADTIETPLADPLMAMPPLTTDLFEPREDHAPRKTAAFSFHTSQPAEPSPARQPRESDIEVDALESFDPTDIQRELDDATQEMLAADYEAEFTRTQLLEQEAATRALREGAAPEHDVTIEMQGYDTSSDTVRMPVDDDTAFAQATEARYIDETTASFETEAMPGLDLELDLPSTSAILESGSEALAEALGEDFELDADEAPRKKQA